MLVCSSGTLHYCGAYIGLIPIKVLKVQVEASGGVVGHAGDSVGVVADVVAGGAYIGLIHK